MTLKPYTPEIYIGSMVSCAGEDPFEVAHLNARAALDDDDVLLVHFAQGEKVYFLAAHARDFAGNVGCGTELGHALPGARGHQGDGLYKLPLGHDIYCVAKQGDTIRTFSGDEDLINEYASEHGLKVINVDGLDPIAWQGFRTYNEDLSRKIVKTAMFVGIGLAVVLTVLWVGMSVATASLKSGSSNAAAAVEKNLQDIAAVYQSNLSQPMDVMLADLHRLKSVVGRKDGVIKFYRIENGKAKWEIHLPKWVSGEDYQSLGTGLKADQDGDIIVVRKE